MNKESGASQEKPLSGSSRLALFGGAGAVIILSYIVFTAFVFSLLLLMACEFVVMAGLARFGLARMVAWVLGAHINLLTVFFRSCWLRKGVEFRIQLQPSDAPSLFAILKALCQKAQVEMPREVLVEMGVNAWVQLKGYRRGGGRTTLGIGYDLLAGLSVWEMEGVLAHEITHAKLVQRGYKNWMNRGLGRLRQLAQGMYVHVEGYRKAGRLVEPAPFMFGVTDKLTRLAARMVAACSRQDEFDADLGAAALCGPTAIRSSLLKLEPLGQHAARLPWNERVARLQTGEGFSQWLVSELASADFKRTNAPEQNLFFKYSTHPTLADRLAVLPDVPNVVQPESPPAITLLNDPDKVAEALISEIQKRAAEVERKDSKRLRRVTRKSGIHANLRPLQLVGVVMILVAGVGGVAAWLVAGLSFALAGSVAGAILVGTVCFRLGRYRERLALAVPEFTDLKAAWQSKQLFTDEQVKAMEAEMKARVASTLSRKRRELEFATLSYDALSRCDYLRAHIAARLCLQVNSKSVEGALGLAVAAAAFRRVQDVHQALNYLQKVTAMTAPSIVWGAGWALLLCGDWVPAEAFLEKISQRKKPRNPTLLLLLALCQSNRGKLQSALLIARQVCSPEPLNKEHAKFLIDLLLQAGYLREAQEQLKRLEASAQDDTEIMLQMVRLNLLTRNFTMADEWAERMRQKQPGAHVLVWLGQHHEVARQDQKAFNFYNEALAAGFYPESLLGLARLESHGQNKEQARKHLMAALDTRRDLGAKAVGPLPLFHQITGQLLALQDPVPTCRAWVASLNGGKSPPGLENKSLLIYAGGRQQAEQFLNELVFAMQPGLPPIVPSSIGWKEAEKERQPDGPVRPGIQGVLN